LAIRIPADLAEACALSEGSELEVRHEDGVLVLVPDRTRRKRYTLGRLVAGITPRNRPKSVDWGRARGREAW
jgi:antitoxin MazE